VSTIWVGKMSYGLNKTLQMCTVETESRLGYKSSQVQSKSSKNGLKSGLEYYKSMVKTLRRNDQMLIHYVKSGVLFLIRWSFV